MKSIGEISIATPDGAGFREFSSCDGRETEQPREPQHSGPKGEAGSTAPRPSHTILAATPQPEDKLLRKRR